MDAHCKPSMDAAQILELPRILGGGYDPFMTTRRKRDRALPVSDPGDKPPKRSSKALESAPEAVEVRNLLATNMQWLVDHSSAKGSIPAMARNTGVGINTIKRILRSGNGTTVDTLSLICAPYGIEPWQLLHPFRGDKHLNDSALATVERMKRSEKLIEREAK